MGVKLDYPVKGANGGANRLYERREGNEREERIPSNIVGDLDSIRPEVHEYYRSHGTKIIKDDDQNEIDFDKSLRELDKFRAE